MKNFDLLLLECAWKSGFFRAVWGDAAPPRSWAKRSMKWVCSTKRFVLTLAVLGLVFASAPYVAWGQVSLTRADRVAEVIKHAENLREAGDFPNAQKILEAQLAKTELKFERAALQNALADVHFTWAENLRGHFDLQNAISHYRAAYETDQVLRLSLAAIELNNIGQAYDNLSRSEEALSYYQQSLAIRREVQDREGEAATLNNIGAAYNRLSRYDEALRFLEQALLILREVGGRQGEAIVLDSMGVAYRNLGRYEEALSYSQQALPIRREVNDRSGEAVTLDNIGSAYASLSRYDEALHYYELALPIRRAGKNRNGEATTLNNIGGVYDSLSRPEEALRYYEQALAIFEEIKNPGNAARTLNSMGVANFRLSRIEEALRFYQQSLPMLRQAMDRSGEATTLNNMGETYQSLGRYEEALAHLEQALPITREVKDRRTEAATLNSLALAYLGLSRTEDALRYLEQALFIRRQIKDRNGEATILANIGGAQDILNNSEESLAYYQQALAILLEVNDRSGQANALNSIGVTYLHLNRSEEALRYHEQALPIFRQIKDRRGEATTLNNIGAVYQNLSRYNDALGYYEHALSIKREIKERSGEAATLNNIMLTQRAQNKPELAIVYGKQSVNVKQSIRGDIAGLDKTSRDAYLEGNKDTYETLAALLIEQGRLPEAEAVNRLLRESETVGFVRAGDAGGVAAPLPFYGSEQRYLEQYQRIAGDAASVGEKLALLKAIAPGQRTAAQQAEFAESSRQDEVFKTRFRAIRTELVTALADPNATRQIDIVASEEWKKSLRALEAQGAGRVASLSTVMAPDKFYVILTTAYSSEEFSVAVGKVEVEKLAATAAAALQNPRADPRPALAVLYRVMFCEGRLESALQRAQISTALWLVSGNLRSIPLDALHDGEHYLLEKPRQNVGMTLYTRAYLDTPRTGEVLAVGTSQAHAVELKDGATSLGRFNFGPMAGVPAELRGIARDVAAQGTGPLDGAILLDNSPAFTAAQLQQKAGEGYAVLHMATHFSVGLDDRHSFFLLGDGTPFTVADWEIKIPMADLELLTLSACDTGDSKLEQGESGAKIGSLSEIAQKNGAHSVIVTLWSVNDASTSQLMRDFYARWQANLQAGKGEALRAAQRELMGAGAAVTAGEKRGKPIRELGEDETPNFVRDAKHPFAHPYYWAPFTLIGNWR